MDRVTTRLSAGGRDSVFGQVVRRGDGAGSRAAEPSAHVDLSRYLIDILWPVEILLRSTVLCAKHCVKIYVVIKKHNKHNVRYMLYTIQLNQIRYEYYYHYNVTNWFSILFI